MWIKCGHKWLNLSECGLVRQNASGEFSVLVQGSYVIVGPEDAADLIAVLQAQECHTQTMIPILSASALPRLDKSDGMPLRIHIEEGDAA